jgi:hypothetical protein
VAFLGARVSHLADRDAAQLNYRVGDSFMTVWVFDPSGWDISGPSKHVNNHEIYVNQVRGVTVVYYRDRGIGYAYASADMDQNQMVQLVSTNLEDDD